MTTFSTRNILKTAVVSPVVSLAMLACVAGQAQAQQQPAARKPVGPPATAVGRCPPLAAMPREISIGTRYSAADRTFSTVDPEKQYQQAEYRKRFNVPLRTVMNAANRAAANGERDADMACLAGYFATLAEGRAMEGASKELDDLYRSWTVGSLGVIYLRFQDKLDDYPGADAVHRWFGRTGQGLIRQYQPRLQRGEIANHLYWAGAAVAVFGEINQDPGFRAFGADVLRAGVGQVRPDGTLPAESGRGKMARHYHMFAATPLVAITLVNPDTQAIARGNNDGLNRLIDTVAASYADPAGGPIARKSGAGQLPENHFRDLNVLRYYPGLGARSRASLDRTVGRTEHYNSYFGGNLDFLLGRP